MNILVFGDSITQGFYDTEGAGWVNRLAAFGMKRDVDSDHETYTSVFNLGISGDNSKHLLARCASEMERRIDPDDETAVIISIGANDSQYEVRTGAQWIPMEQFERNLTSIVEHAKKVTKKIFLVGTTPIDESLLTPIPWKPTHAYRADMRNEYSRAIQRVSEGHGVQFISMEHIFPPDSEHLVDGVHPTTKGHQLIFERVKHALEGEGVL